MRSNHQKFFPPAGLFVLATTMWVQSVVAAPSEVESLRREVADLRAEVLRMEARLDAWEARLGPSTADRPRPGAPLSLTAEEPSLIQRLATQAQFPDGATEQPWHHPESWKRIELGATVEAVIEVLGTPTFDEPSLNRTVDRVLTYQARDAATRTKVRGKVKFKRGKVVAIEPPRFP